MKAKVFSHKILISFLVIILIVGGFLNALFLLNHNVLIRGLKIGHIAVGGLSQEDAYQKIEQAIENWLSRPIKLTLSNKSINTSWRSLGLIFDLESTIKKAAMLGKGRNLIKDVRQAIAALLGKYDLPMSLVWDEQVLENFNQINFKEYLEADSDAVLSYQNRQIVLTPSRAGRAPDWQGFKNRANQRAVYFEPFGDYQLNLISVLPDIKDDETEIARIKAETLLKNTPLALEFENQKWEIDQDVLGNWLVFMPVFEGNTSNKILGFNIDKTLVTNYLLELVPEINRSSKNAHLSYQDGKIIVDQPAESGTEVLIEESVDKMIEDILDEKAIFNLVVKETEALVNEDTLAKLGIDILIGKGESNFTGSSLARVNNIKVGSGKFDEQLIKPGEEFSFNTSLGEISGEAGYLPGLVIKNNTLVPEFGGGICQVSTTMFRAAVNSGLEITERYPHSFPVGYYNPQGFDATVYPPHPDLRFINNTSGHILIQRKIEGNKLIFEMYGKNENKEVKIKGPTVYEKNEEDGSMKAVLWQEVYQDGKLLFKKGFWSYYKSPSLYPVVQNPLE